MTTPSTSAQGPVADALLKHFGDSNRTTFTAREAGRQAANVARQVLSASPSPEALPASGVEAALSDPIAVHRNMLAGTIAKPSLMNLAHLYPEIQQMRQALIATLKHFRWPTSAEHQTRDQVMAALALFDDPPMIPAALTSAPAPEDRT